MSNKDKVRTAEFIAINSIERNSFNRQISSFSNGVEIQDKWIKNRAYTNHLCGYTSTYFCLYGGTIVGYYGICNASISRLHLPADLRLGTPNKIPAIKLAQLGVHWTCQNQGFGKILLISALKKAALSGKYSAFAYVLVDPLTEAVISFYEKFGFREFSGYDEDFPVLALPRSSVFALAESF